VDATTVLGQDFGFHPVALDYCLERNHMPMVHGYSDHTFLVLHRPLVLLRYTKRQGWW